MKRKRIRWSAMLALAVGLLLLGTVVRSVLAGPAVSPRPRDAQRAGRVVRPAAGVDERTTVPEGNNVGGNGVVEPAQRETRVAGSAPGRIAVIHVHEGDFVEQGVPLIDLDAAPERATLAAAMADVSVAEAQLARTVHGNRHDDIDAAIADAEAAHARAESSADILRRQEALAPSGAVTPDELDRARRTAAADLATYHGLDARRRVMAAGSRQEDVLVARAQVLSARARRDQAQANVDRLTVRAPLAGQILQLRLHEGEYYTPGGADPLALMGDTRRLRVRIDVDERDVGRVRVAASAFVTADAFRGERFAGHVVEIGRRMGRKNIRTDDPTERLDTKILEVVVELDRAERLIPGQRVMGYIAVDTSTPGGS